MVAQPGPALRVSWPETHIGSRPALNAAAQGASGGHNKVKAQSEKSAAVREAEKPEPQKAARRPPATASCGGISANFQSRSHPSAAVPSCARLPPALPFPSLRYPRPQKAWAWGILRSVTRGTCPSPAPRLGQPGARRSAALVRRILPLHPRPCLSLSSGEEPVGGGGRRGERSWRLPQGSHSARKPVPTTRSAAIHADSRGEFPPRRRRGAWNPSPHSSESLSAERAPPPHPGPFATAARLPPPWK